MSDMESTIKKLRDNFRCYGSQLAKSEYLTRAYLVDPVLAALRWHPLASQRVVTEYGYEPEKQGKSKMTDYALWRQSKCSQRPVCFVEVKALGNRLGLDYNNQTLRSRLNEQKYYADYLILTNGDIWNVFGTAPKKLDEDRRLHFHLSKGKCSERVEDLAKLSKLLTEPEQDPGWAPLSDFEIATVGTKLPRAIKFPETAKVSIETWPQMLIHMAKWLYTKKLSVDCRTIMMHGNTARAALVAPRIPTDGKEDDWVRIGDSSYLYALGGSGVIPKQAQKLLDECTKKSDLEDVYLQVTTTNIDHLYYGYSKGNVSISEPGENLAGLFFALALTRHPGEPWAVVQGP